MSVYPFPPSWQSRLDEALTEAEVVGIARDFLATLSPYDIARLPVHCRPTKIVDAWDITNYAFAIVRQYCDDERGSPRVARRLASFFSSASIRLSQLLSVPNIGEDLGGASRPSL